MRRSFLLALMAACSVAPLSAAPASPNSWIFLGARNMGSGTERETVDVTSTSRFHQLQACVFNTPLQLNAVSIHFEDGQKQDFPVDARIAGGECTRVIDLASAPRRVQAVELTYKRVSRFRRAPMVRIVGR